MAHIDGWAIFFQREFHDLDCPVHARAKAARTCKQQRQGGLCRSIVHVVCSGRALLTRWNFVFGEAPSPPCDFEATPIEFRRRRGARTLPNHMKCKALGATPAG